MKNTDKTSILITSILVFLGIAIVVFITENMGIHGWQEILIVATTGAIISIIVQYIYKTSSKHNN